MSRPLLLLRPRPATRLLGVGVVPVSLHLAGRLAVLHEGVSRAAA